MSQVERPNVLFVVVDDLRLQLGCYRQSWVLSPNIDALAADGLLFERAYCQQATCAPSRSSVLSGCRPDTTRIYNLKVPLRTAMPDVLTLPQHFRNHGYETVSIGKVYHHAEDDPQGWSVPPWRAQGTWKGRGYLTDEAWEAILFRDEQEPDSPRKGIGPAYECADVPDDAYADGGNAARAIEELRRLAGRPFFMALGLHKPHLPFNAPKRYWDLYAPEALPLAPNPFAPEGVTEYSLTNFGELRGYVGMPKTGPVQDDLARTLLQGYCACVSYVDAQLGRVLTEMDRLKLRDNTVIVLWGDHGWKLGEHGSWSKHTNFEIDTNAPMILAAPATRGRGIRTAALAEFVDMYPTLCELCGVPTPEHLEGLRAVPLLADPGRPWKRAAFSQFPRGSVMGYTMRTERYRYTEWQDRRSGEVLAHELYDHEADDQENTNAADKPDNADLIRRLARQLGGGWRGALPS